MMADSCAPNQRDLVSDRRTQMLLWRLPMVAIIASFFASNSTLKATIWTAAFTQMGVACLANASRCGRRHCYFTGPLFLLGAVASLLRGFGAIRLSWASIGLIMLVGWAILGRLPEMLWGKYARWGS